MGNYYDPLRSNYYNNELENNKNMAQIRGTVQFVPEPRAFTKGNRTTTYWSIKVNDTYYSTGSIKPPAAGTLVEFDAEQNQKGYWDVSKAGVRVVRADNPVSGNIGAIVSNSAQSSPMSKDDYWRRKEERDLTKEASYEARDKVIQLQSCRNSAIEFVKLLLTETKNDKGENLGPALKLPAAVAKREAVLAAVVDKYTQEFVKQNNNNNNELNSTQNIEGNTKNNEESLSIPQQDPGIETDDDAAWEA